MVQRHAISLDANHAEIVRALRKVGCRVLELALFGLSPDLLVLTPRGELVLMEIKTSHGTPNQTQRTLLADGWPIAIVHSVAEAWAAAGVRVS